MNGSVLPRIAEFDCRSCGSKYQKQSNNARFCSSCWGEFERWIKQMEITDRSDLSINRWMARRLMLDAERLTRYGITGRCEAVSTAGNRRWIGGFDAQCRLRATKKRDGRQVCERHSMATSPIYVGEEMHDPYTDLTRVLTHLASTDVRFRQCLVSALVSPGNADDDAPAKAGVTARSCANGDGAVIQNLPSTEPGAGGHHPAPSCPANLTEPSRVASAPSTPCPPDGADAVVLKGTKP